MKYIWQEIVDIIVEFQCTDWIYIGAMSFQLAGAIVLLLSYCGKMDNVVLRVYFPGSNFTNVDKQGKSLLEKNKLRQCAKQIYLNRISFAYIATGYALGIFGEITSDKYKIMVAIIFITILLILIAKIFAWLRPKTKYTDDKKEDYSKIKKKTDADVNVVEF